MGLIDVGAETDCTDWVSHKDKVPPLFLLQKSTQFTEGNYLSENENCIMISYDENTQNSDQLNFRTRLIKFENKNDLDSFNQH